MTLACRYPDRVDGVISLDAAPVNEKGNHAFGSFTYHLLEFMHNMKVFDEAITVEKAVDAAKRTYAEKPQFSALIERSIKTKPDVPWAQQKDDPLEWAINLATLRGEFLNIPFFDETLRYHGPAFNIVGGRSRYYPFEQYKKVFPNQT